MKRLSLFALLIMVSGAVLANVRLSKLFGNNMVLQRGKPITIWGWADAKEKVEVRFKGQKKSVTASKDGSWKVILGPEEAGGPYALTVSGKNAITLDNVLVGDVWICSGQSNMEWPLRSSANALSEIQQANYPQVRHFKVPNTVASLPQSDISGGAWTLAVPETVGDFTAVGYFFARELYKELNVPIGLINTSWGGTHVETWTSREAFAGNDEFKDMIASMPRLNLDSISKVKITVARKRIEALQGSWESTAGASQWKDLSFDDSQWPKATLPGHWEQGPLGDIDGTVWYRKIITIPASYVNKSAVLELSKIDDSDETFVNGMKVGEMKSKYSEKRIYTLPAGLLKEGKNVIAVRVEDTGGGGGIYGNATDMKLDFTASAIPLAGEWSYKVESLLESSRGVGPNAYPTLLFNAMIRPLIPYAFKGALWYQGEANTERAYQYRKSFPLMITDWRKQWQEGDFPFYFVQLATFNANGGNSSVGSGWAELREAQTLTLSLPNTGMAVTTDIGNPSDIHPINKQDVGKRLAAVALHRTYGKNIVDSGPVYQSMKIDGNKAIITFSNIGTGLIAKDRYGYVKGFEIAGADQKFHYAKALIEGDHVTVYHDDVSVPVAVRFGWADDAGDDNLYNKEGFPAGPFRTDSWKGITEGVKFKIE